ncbi:glycosyltransferase [Helicobacter cetorum]|uniref:glycosyltransferase n=1 Tax=Helicobacter cetorum TaxID=138563 RepID=UPI000CF020F6|nr:glycosyltransferase [Helicobacter cetorum]
MRILVLCASNPKTNPRPSRLISFLKQHHQVSAMGIGTNLKECAIEGVKTFIYPPYQKRSFLQEMLLVFNALIRNYKPMILTKNRLKIVEILQEHAFEVIVCHDLVLLPIVLKYKKQAKVILDLREFYSATDVQNFRFRMLFSPFFSYLTKTYAKECDKVWSVSYGLKKLYFKHYALKTSVLYSLPLRHNLSISPTDENNIGILYHGSASVNRGLERLLEMAQFLEKRFFLDLMLVGDKNNIAFLKERAKALQKKGVRVRVIEPVSFENLIPFSNAYDIGLYANAPTNLNIINAMPNKFFEYIQSLLALVVVPNLEMQRMLRFFKNGIASKSSSPESLAQTINALRVCEIQDFKKHSFKASQILCYKHNELKIERVLKEMFEK